MVFEKCTNANSTALSRVLFQGEGSLSFAVNTPIQIGGRYKATSTFSPVGSLSSNGLRMRVCLCSLAQYGMN